MKRIYFYLSIFLPFLALSAWAGVIYFSFAISAAQSAYQTDTQTQQQTYTEQNSTVGMHALVQGTAAGRAQLDTLLSSDVTHVATALRGVGKTTGVAVTLGGALPEDTAASTAANPSIQTVAFSLEADGSFAALMRTEAIIETLPLPSSVERFDIQRSGTGSIWHMSVSIRVLISANASS